MKDRNNSNIPFEILNVLMSERGISAEKLAQLTEVPRKFILLIQSGNFYDLPSRPYIVAYLKKIAAALRVDEQSMVVEYENALLKKSGGDKLPSNRFAKASGLTWQLVFTAVVIWAFAAFLGYRFNEITGVPAFKVDLPSVVTSPALQINGRLEQGDNISINGQTINTDAGGDFSTTIYLNPGVNSFDFVISRFLGKESSRSASVDYIGS